jgi:hypothetical protein
MVAFTISFTPKPEGGLSTRHAQLHGGLTASLSEYVSVKHGEVLAAIKFCCVRQNCWLLACDDKHHITVRKEFQRKASAQLNIACITHRGARTHDHKVKDLALYRLS